MVKVLAELTSVLVELTKTLSLFERLSPQGLVGAFISQLASEFVHHPLDRSSRVALGGSKREAQADEFAFARCSCANHRRMSRRRIRASIKNFRSGGI